MKQASAIYRRTCGHSLSTDDDAEQGTPSTAAEGELPKVEEELNSLRMNGLKAMNRDRIQSR